jgi:hypothetical protein
MAEVFDPETHDLRVMEDKCSTCIFGDHTTRAATARRVREMVEETRQDELGMGHIPCHHTLPYSSPPQTKSAICRGWWDLEGKKTWWGRLAIQWELVKWWKEPV